MINVSKEAIIGQKVLPYDIFDVNKDKLFSAGEILTPGKIMALRAHETLYIKQPDSDGPMQPITIKNDDEIKKEKPESEKQAATLKGKVNKTSKIAPVAQISFKSEYGEAIAALRRGEMSVARKVFLSIRDKIVHETRSVQKSVHYCSELKLLGEHHECHALNTAIFSAFLAAKLDYSETILFEIVLGALLHDIGKTRLPTDLYRGHSSSKDEDELYQKHPIYGYNIIKYKMKFPEHIARIALEHHETIDGTGWPYGISSTMIDEHSQIVAVCSYFDNLTSNQGGEVRSFRDALKALLMKGSKTFSPKPLYAFVHMFGYGDCVSLEELAR